MKYKMFIGRYVHVMIFHMTWYIFLMTFMTNRIKALWYWWKKSESWGLCWKINLIWSHSMRVSLSAYALFSRSLYIYKILFDPLNLELGTIPIQTNKIFKNRISNLINPGQELNLNKILIVNNFLLKKKQLVTGHIKIINLFPSC